MSNILNCELTLITIIDNPIELKVSNRISLDDQSCTGGRKEVYNWRGIWGPDI